MPELGALGRMLLVLGAVLLGLGVLLMAADKIPGMGRLPGDIYVKRGNFSFFFPITTSILLSIILTVIWSLLRR